MSFFFFFFFFCPKPPPSSTLFVQTRLFPSPCVQILNVLSPLSASSGKHLYAYEKTARASRKGERTKREAIKAIKLPIFADSYLTILAYHCLRGGGKKSPAAHANEAAREKKKKKSKNKRRVRGHTSYYAVLKGAWAMQPICLIKCLKIPYGGASECAGISWNIETL